MNDTLATGASAAPASSPSPAPSPPAASTAPPAASPRPSAPHNPRSVGHSPARDRYAEIREAQDQGKAPASDQPAPPPSADEQQPAADTAAKTKVGRYEVSETQLGEMLQRQAQEDLRRATVPASAEQYEAKLPEGLKLPGNQEYRFDVNDPSLIAARNLAHAKGWSQSDFSEALGIFASHYALQEAQLAERSRAEIAKVGANAPQRVDAVGRWITGEVGEADARPIRATIVTDAHLRFYEKIMRQLEGGASFSQSHRVAPDDNSRIPGYDRMSFEERRFAQDTLAARRNSR